MSRLAALARYVRGPSAASDCELCTAPLDADHEHLVDLEERRILCICHPCSLLFRGSTRRRYRAVPHDVRREVPFAALDAWNELGIPVGVAFCFYSSSTARWTTILPGPAGATEAEVDEAHWEAVRSASPLARSLAPDVEALLVRVLPNRPVLAFAVPIDRCYALAGILRRTWKGFDGGEKARAEIDTFFAQLAGASRPIGVQPRVAS
jgi:hypothetical protein